MADITARGCKIEFQIAIARAHNPPATELSQFGHHRQNQLSCLVGKSYALQFKVLLKDILNP